MRLKKILLILCIMMGFVSCSMALTPDYLLISTDKPWVVTGGTDHSIINIQVVNKTNPTSPVTGVQVVIQCNETYMGSVIPTSPQAVMDTNVTATFIPNITSGDATIYAYIPGYDVSNKTIQHVDHAEPKYYSQLIYPGHQEVNGRVDIITQVTDQYGNPVDNIYERDQNLSTRQIIKYSVPETTDGGFGDSRIKSSSIEFDDDGYANITYYLSKYAEVNLILTTAPVTVISNARWISIRGIPDTPIEENFTSYITSNVEPYDIGQEEHVALPDDKDKFRIYYYVKDKYGNGVGGINVHWQMWKDLNPSPIYDIYFFTNDLGYIYLEIGPSTRLETFNLLAQIEDINLTEGESWKVNDKLIIKSIGDESLTIRAQSESIVSRNVSPINPISNMTVFAVLLDGQGNGIPNQNITFEIGPEVAHKGIIKYNSSFSPYEIDTTAFGLTDETGVASVKFFAPEFRHENEEGYDAAANSEVRVLAIWNGTEAPYLDKRISTFADIKIKSYPFLRAEIEIEPDIVEKNQTFEVTISLIGDGAVPRMPVDVVLCDSRGETMLGDLYAFQGQTGAINDKEVWTQVAISKFAQRFNAQDRVGLVSFGMIGVVDALNGPSSGGYAGPDGGSSAQQLAYAQTKYRVYPKNYPDYATLDIPLTYVTDDMRSLILTTNVSPSKQGIGGGGRREVPTRYGLYTCLKELATNSSSSNRVKAVVLLLDDQRSGWGDPLASRGCTLYNPANQMTCADWSQGKSGEYCAFPDLGGCGDPRQNLASYANSLGVRIFTILLPQKGCQMNSATRDEAIAIAQLTGGQEYDACSATELDQWYQDIAEKLFVYASVDTRMSANFGAINYTYLNTTNTANATDEFSYVPIQYSSTNVTSWWIKNGTTVSDTLNTSLYPSNKYPYWFDQSEEWKNKKLNFYIGNITIGQIWRAKFTLNATGDKYGIFHLFDQNEECPIKYIVDPEWGAGENGCIKWSGKNNITKLGEFAGSPDIPTPIAIECISPENAYYNATCDCYLSNSTTLVDISWSMKYNSTGDITLMFETKYATNLKELRDVDCDDGGLIRKMKVLLGEGPFPPSQEGNMEGRNTIDLSDRYGYYKVCIRAEEQVYPVGLGHMSADICDYIIHYRNLGKIIIR